MEVLNIKEFVKQEKEKLRQVASDHGIRPKLGIIDATDELDAANQIYIKNKIKDFTEMGWEAKVYSVIEDTCLFAIDEAIDDDCTSIIVQLPTRKGIFFSPKNIPILYDCDGLHPASLVHPATPGGIIKYLDACGFDYEGKLAVVVGRSDIVGKPMAKMLLDKNMTVCQCHSKTKEEDRNYLLRRADLVVAAVGVPELITRYDCPNAFIVDVGINRLENGKLVGDFEYDDQEEFATPVPGGVGLLTRLQLLENCLILTARQKRIILR